MKIEHSNDTDLSASLKQIKESILPIQEIQKQLTEVKPTIKTSNMSNDHNEYIRTAGEMRGIVLNQFIVLEWLIEKFIANHFFSSQKLRDEFLKEFIYGTRMSFNKKIQIFKNLVRSKDYIKYENISNKFSEFEKEIGILSQARNLFAHTPIDHEYFNNYINEKNKIAFMKPYYDDENKQVVYDLEEYNNLLRLLRKWISELTLLQEVVLPSQMSSLLAKEHSQQE